MSKQILIDFNINEELSEKFLKEFSKLDQRTKRIFEENDFLSLKKFRKPIVGKAGINNFWVIRGVGIQTENTFVKLFRKTLITSPDYSAVRRDYNKEFKKLSGHAKNALIFKGMGLFETFYYVYFIKKQPVSFDNYPFDFVRKELKSFIRLRCQAIRAVRRIPKSKMDS